MNILIKNIVLLLYVLFFNLLISCANERFNETIPPKTKLHFPISLALTQNEDFLVVCNSDFNLQYSWGSLSVIDLSTFDKNTEHYSLSEKSSQTSLAVVDQKLIHPFCGDTLVTSSTYTQNLVFTSVRESEEVVGLSIDDSGKLNCSENSSDNKCDEKHSISTEGYQPFSLSYSTFTPKRDWVSEKDDTPISLLAIGGLNSVNKNNRYYGQVTFVDIQGFSEQKENFFWHQPISMGVDPSGIKKVLFENNNLSFLSFTSDSLKPALFHLSPKDISISYDNIIDPLQFSPQVFSLFQYTRLGRANDIYYDYHSGYFYVLGDTPSGLHVFGFDDSLKEVSYLSFLPVFGSLDSMKFFELGTKKYLFLLSYQESEIHIVDISQDMPVFVRTIDGKIKDDNGKLKQWLNGPYSLTLSRKKNIIFVANFNNHQIAVMDISSDDPKNFSFVSLIQ